MFAYSRANPEGRSLVLQKQLWYQTAVFRGRGRFKGFPFGSVNEISHMAGSIRFGQAVAGLGLTRQSKLNLRGFL